MVGPFPFRAVRTASSLATSSEQADFSRGRHQYSSGFDSTAINNSTDTAGQDDRNSPRTFTLARSSADMEA